MKFFNNAREIDILSNVYKKNNYFSLYERKIYTHTVRVASLKRCKLLYTCDKTSRKICLELPLERKMPCIR